MADRNKGSVLWVYIVEIVWLFEMRGYLFSNFVPAKSTRHF